MNARTVFAWILVLVLGAVTWFLVQPVLSWLLATALLAFVLVPVHRRLEDRIGPRLSAGLLVAVVVLGIIGPLAVGARTMLIEGPVLLEEFSETRVLQQVQGLLDRHVGLSIPVQSLARQGAERLSEYAARRAETIVTAGLHAGVGFLLLTFVLYYLIKDGERFVEWLERVTPLHAEVREELFASANAMTWAVLKGHVLVAFVQGVVAGISLFVTGVPEALLLTIAMMGLALIPIVGVAPVLGGAVVYLLVEGRPLSAAFVVVWGFSVVAVTDDYLRSVLIDHESEMHSAVVFVGITGGVYLLGAMGIFIGPILIGLFKTTIEVLSDHYGMIDR